MLSKQQFLEAGKRRYEDVPIPGGTMRIQSLTEPEKLRYYSDRVDDKGTYLVGVAIEKSPRLLILSIVDENGDRMFSDEELEVVKGLDATVTEPLYVAARKLSRMDPDEKEKEGDAATEKKPDSASGSDSSTS